ncbi:MAG TPA: NlpC/P60 family protein [Tepidisphaeraceae bacterium]|nr:NlpC/P60 family protein [Tepidisphaeraceae bacterium]
MRNAKPLLALFVLLTWLHTPSHADEPAAPAGATTYRSPYFLEFSYSTDALIGDLLRGPLGDPRTISAVPYDSWNSAAVRKKYGAWGPPMKRLEPSPELAQRPAQWKRERVIAVASHYVGCTYQHHHLPDWNPPADWPWKEVGHGSNAKGVDCSNFTGLVYNLALGVRMSTEIVQQGADEDITVNGEGARKQHVTLIPKPATYEACLKDLRTGDLLYILNKQKEVSHVVIWVGTVGRSPSDVPLVIDSTGSSHKDSSHLTIPDGVQLRPFTRTGWYFQSLSHVHRIISDSE